MFRVIQDASQPSYYYSNFCHCFLIGKTNAAQNSCLEGKSSWLIFLFFFFSLGQPEGTNSCINSFNRQIGQRLRNIGWRDAQLNKNFLVFRLHHHHTTTRGQEGGKTTTHFRDSGSRSEKLWKCDSSSLGEVLDADIPRLSNAQINM